MRPNRRFMSTRRIAFATSLMLIASVGLSLAAPSIAQAVPMIYRVDDGATGLGTGQNWTDAFDDLQDALAVAVAGDEIWVAAGTYSPGPARTDSFVLVPDTTLLGGFVGTPANPTKRDPDANETILTGELGVAGDNTDNTQHIVDTASGGLFGTTFVVDGFTITGGYADGSGGGGLRINGGTAELSYLKVTDNYSEYSGAGIFTGLSTDSVTLTDTIVTGSSGGYSANAVELVSNSGTALVDNVVIDGNSVRGLEIWRAEATITNLTVTNNGGTNPGGGNYAAGGVQVTESDLTTIINSEISNNSKTNGAGLLVSKSHVEGHNLVIAENLGGSGSTDAGGLWVDGEVHQITGDNYASFTGYNVSFVNNASSSATGRHIYIDDELDTAGTAQLASATFYNSLVWGPGNPGDHFWPLAPNITWVNSSVVDSGGSGAGWDTDAGIDGGGNIGDNPLVVGWNSGDYRIRFYSPAVAAGDASLLPADIADLDDDGDTTEPLPYDVNGVDRIQGSRLDLGAYEVPHCVSGLSVVRVDHEAIVLGNGSTWANALNELDTAIEGVPFCDTYPYIDIWVADGTYYPTTDGDRDVAFSFPGGLDVYGGFAGTETTLDQRNPTANRTILSGEIGAAGVTDNSRNVVRFDTLGKSAGRLDGFTVRDGYDAGSGSGGAGIYVDDSWAVLANLVVENNHAVNGGGVAFRSTTGAQMYNSIVRNNTASTGAGVHVDNGSSPLVVNTLVHDNTATGKAGGIVNDGGLQIFSSTIANNTGLSFGGFFGTAGGTMDNTIIWGNSPAVAGDASAGMAIRNSNIEGTNGSGGTWAGPGSDGGGNVDNNPLFVNAATGDFRLQVGSPSIGTGLNAAAVADALDIDDDGDTTEAAPDLTGNDRILDGTIEMGPYEYILDDADGDGVADAVDNCPGDPNADQLDTDGDDDGDACDTDDDDDNVLDVDDNCSLVSNSDQANNDGDSEGDVCDDDDDNDGELDGDDNCQFDANPGQENLDNDIYGDACDDDLDGDSVNNGVDNCPRTANLNQKDNDQDDIGDRCDDDDDNDGELDVDDNCQFAANPDQSDSDGDGVGDACEGDTDGDGVPDPQDNCSATSNADQTNTDGDALGDACDSDDDNDTRPDSNDNCPLVANTNQADADGDGLGNVCDPTPNGEPEPEPAVVFESLTPARYADSRDEDTFDTKFRNTGPRAGGSTWEIEIAGRGDVPATATAAVLNLTVLNATGPGFATVHPCGTLPQASSVNYAPGAVEPNEVIAKLSAAGTVCVFTKTTADVIIDVVGYTPDNSPYAALTPARFADSRNEATFDDTFRNTGPRDADTSWEIQITGRGNVPTTATAAVINLTVTGGQAPGFATVYPCGTLPTASSINYAPGITRPNELIAKLSPTGAVCVFTKSTVDVIIDVVGYINDVPGYTALTPARFADSRDEATFDDTFRNTGPRDGDTEWEIKIAGRGNVPADATAAVINLTVTGAAGPGFATAHPCGTLPKASSINYDATTTRPNELIAKLSPAGTICIFTKTTTHIIIDVVGHT